MLFYSSPGSHAPLINTLFIERFPILYGYAPGQHKVRPCNLFINPPDSFFIAAMPENMCFRRGLNFLRAGGSRRFMQVISSLSKIIAKMAYNIFKALFSSHD
jgi:hypothetical protein